MADLSSRWLIAMIAAVALLCGTVPALIAHVVMVMGLLLVFIWRDAHGKFGAADPVATVLVGLVIVWCAASLQWTLLPARGMYDLVVLMILAVLALQLPPGIMQLEAAAATRILKIFIAIIVFSILLFVMDVGMDMIWQRIWQGKTWDYHMMSSSISRPAMCLVLLLWPIIHYCCTRHWHLLAFFMWVIFGVTLLLTDSANVRLAFAVSTMVFLVASHWPQFVRLGIAAVMIAGLALAVPAAKVTQDLLESSGRKLNSSFMHRTEIWKFTAARIAEKPIMGWGFDSSRAIPNGGEVSKYQGYDPMKSIIPMHPHNWFLQALLELGMVGAILLTALWLWFLRQTAWLHPSMQAPALATYGIAMVIGAFSVGIWQSWWLCALLFVTLIIQLLNHEAHRARQ